MTLKGSELSRKLPENIFFKKVLIYVDKWLDCFMGMFDQKLSNFIGLL